jgi:hypothetical protein
MRELPGNRSGDPNVTKHAKIQLARLIQRG